MTAVAAEPSDGGHEPPSDDHQAAPGVGDSALGSIQIADQVVAKIAARAAAELPDAGASATRVLGRSVPGAGRLGLHSADLDGLPKTSADVDGAVVYVTLELAVRWPASVVAVTEQVREHVSTRVGELTGLRVAEVQIMVSDLVTHIASPPRVR